MNKNPLVSAREQHMTLMIKKSLRTIDKAVDLLVVLRAQCEDKTGLKDSTRNDIFQVIDALKELRKQMEWQPIETAPKDGFFLVGCNDPEDKRPPFVMSGEILGLEDGHSPAHLSFKYLTHWKPLDPLSSERGD